MKPLPTLRAPLLFAAAVLSAAPAPAADEHTEQIHRLEGELRTAPDHGGVLFLLARERALAGDAAGALRDLERAIATGLDLDVEAENAFLLLRNKPEFMALLDRALDQRVVARTSSEAFRVPERDLIPEGLAHDPVTGDFFLGSLFKRKIVRIAGNLEGSAQLRIRDFATSGQDGLWEVLGMKVDAKRRLLWVMTAAGKAAGAQEGCSAALVYDLGTGTLARRYLLDNAKARHLFNDVALAADGRAFLTDSEAGTVWRIDPGKDAPELLLKPWSLGYPNGIALSADEKRLYVADFEHGIAIVDAASGDLRPLPHPPNVSLHGVDGLYRHDSGLVAVQNGARTERIVRFRLDKDGLRVVSLDILESRNPAFAIPTTGVIVGSEFYYIANSLLDRLGPDGRLKPNPRLEPVVILKAPLARP
jgi:sugar lactone lactonase YvrE